MKRAVKCLLALAALSFPTLLAVLLPSFPLAGAQAAEQGAQQGAERGAGQGANVLFILDASGSMRAKIQKKQKIDIAKDVMTKLVRELPAGVKPGLEVYGHRRKGDCDDIELMVPVGKGDKETLIREIRSVRPKGQTPITRALQIAADKLAEAEEETTLVLVSDGKETCKGDPCALVKSLKDKGIKLKVHVVGFDVTDAEKEQLACIAEAGGGKYFTARNADQLAGALTEVKQEVIEKAEAPKPPPRETKVIKLGVSKITIPNIEERTVEVYGQGSGQWVGSIQPKKKSLEVPPGVYKLKFDSYELPGVEVNPGQPAEILLGSVVIPNLSARTVEVYEQKSGNWVGSLKPHKKKEGGASVSLPGSTKIEVKDAELGDTMGDVMGDEAAVDRGLEVPAGLYKLKFNSYEIEDIQVAAGKPTQVQIGSISMPNLSERTVEVYEQKSGSWVGSLQPNAKLVEVPAGTYKLKFGNQFMENIAVEPGQDVVLEQ